MPTPIEIPPNLQTGGELDGSYAPGPGPNETLTITYTRDSDGQVFDTSMVVTPPVAKYPFWHLYDGGARVVIGVRLQQLSADVSADDQAPLVGVGRR